MGKVLNMSLVLVAPPIVLFVCVECLCALFFSVYGSCNKLEWIGYKDGQQKTTCFGGFLGHDRQLKLCKQLLLSQHGDMSFWHPLLASFSERWWWGLCVWGGGSAPTWTHHHQHVIMSCSGVTAPATSNPPTYHRVHQWLSLLISHRKIPVTRLHL